MTDDLTHTYHAVAGKGGVARVERVPDSSALKERYTVHLKRTNSDTWEHIATCYKYGTSVPVAQRRESDRVPQYDGGRVRAVALAERSVEGAL